MENRKIVVDTNKLIDNANLLDDDTKEFLIPYVVLAELDGLKRDPTLNYPVRRAIKAIYRGLLEGTVTVIDPPHNAKTNDELIVKAAKDNDAALMSNDIGARAVALSTGVRITEEDEAKHYDPKYKGYEEIFVAEDFFYKEAPHIKKMQPAEFSNIIGMDTVLNCYYVLYTEGNRSHYLFKQTEKDLIEKVDITEKSFRGIGISLSFLHPEQRCAYHAIFDNKTPLTVIQGRVGSGKTLMALCAALARTRGIAQKRYALYERIFITRAPTPVDHNLALGFLPGSLEEKMNQWVSGFISNLEYLFNTTEAAIREEVGQQKFKEYFSVKSLESIQGASYNNKIVIVDEGQLLSVNAMNQIMSRIAEGSKLVILLDPEQTYGANRGNEGWRKVLPYCKGQDLVSYVNLQHIQRGELTKLVQRMFA